MWIDSFEIGENRVKKEFVITSVVSAMIGAGMMLFAIGGARSSGIEGWTPVTEKVAASIQNVAESPSEETKTDKKAAQAGNEVSNEGNKSIATDAAAIPDIEGSANEKASAGANASDGLIHINSAGLKELQNIPGIGEKKAQAILDYRNQHGAFSNVNDLTKVKGIGDKMLQKMKPHIGL
ncbi:ComE operon protein 1 [compost metagenome]